MNGPRSMEPSTVASTARALSFERAELGEGPRWHSGSQSLVWVDITAGRARRSTPDPEWHTDTELKRDGFVSLAQPLPDGGLALALTSSVQWLDSDGNVVTEAPIPLAADERLNDGAVDPLGRLVIGSMHTEGRRGRGRLWRVSPSRVELLRSNASIPNGVAWSPDGSRAYWVDSGERAIHVFVADPSTGEWVSHHATWDLTHHAGSPDGLAVDATGRIWVAMWDAWCVLCLDEHGSVLGRVPLPVRRPTACAIGGRDLNRLFITTATYGLTDDELREQPDAGRVFVSALEPGDSTG